MAVMHYFELSCLLLQSTAISHRFPHSEHSFSKINNSSERVSVSEGVIA